VTTAIVGGDEAHLSRTSMSTLLDQHGPAAITLAWLRAAPICVTSMTPLRRTTPPTNVAIVGISSRTSHPSCDGRTMDSPQRGRREAEIRRSAR
jgi:hypothetical protein